MYYTPELKEFHIGFRFEKFDERLATYNIGGIHQQTNWHQHVYDVKSIRLSQLGTHLYSQTIRVKYLDREDIEELGWKYSGKTQDLHFKLVRTIQPFNLNYRSFRLQYNLDDHRLTILGFEYDNFGPDEEVLFLGKCNNFNELQNIIGKIGL